MTAKLEDVKAEKTDAEDDGTVKIPLRGAEFTIHRDPMNWGFNALEHLNESRIGPALKAIMGSVQYARFEALEPTGYEAIELLNAISGSAGAGDSGN